MINNSSLNLPKFLYRLEKISPDIAFQKGFKPIGTNTNFFNHISGHGLNRNINQEKSSFFISASERKSSAIRLLGSLEYNIDNLNNYYLYKVRANNNAYSVLKTLNNLLLYSKQRQLTFALGEYLTINEMIDFYYNNFSHQYEWFFVGPISPSMIECCWKIDVVKIKNDNVINSNESLKFVSKISNQKIVNFGFVDKNTTANSKPYKFINEDEFISIHDTMFCMDSFGGVKSSLSLTSSTLKTTNIIQKYRDKDDVIKSSFGNSYIDRALVNKPLKHRYDVGPYKFTSPVFSYLNLKTTQTNLDYWFSWELIKDRYVCVLSEENNVKKSPMLIYDEFHRFTLKRKENSVSYCLTSFIGSTHGVYEIRLDVACINDVNQKFYLEPFEDSDYLFRINSEDKKNYSFHIKKNEAIKKIYLLDRFNNNGDFEEIVINIDKNKTLSNLLLPQKSETYLVDIKLSWMFYDNCHIPVPEVGNSKSSLPVDKMFFYDLTTCRIIYFNKNEMYCLYNKRYFNTSKWDWTRWQKCNLAYTHDSRCKWYFDKLSAFNNESASNIKIYSFENNDILGVISKGPNWGTFFTSANENQKNAIYDFKLFENELV